MKFTLKIELGNEAMETGEDVAIALRKQADYIATRYSMGNIQTANAWHNIMDENGNTVGHWTVKP